MSRSMMRMLLVLFVFAATATRAAAAISTAAGTGVTGFNGDGQPATQSKLQFPWQVAIDLDGDLLIANSGNNRVRRVDSVTGLISTVAGTGFSGSGGDGGPAALATLASPSGVIADTNGDILIADSLSASIRRVDVANGSISTALHPIANPIAMTITASGALYVLDHYFQQILPVDLATPMLTVVAGSGNLFPRYEIPNDGGPATAVDLYGAVGFAFDSSGDLFIAESAATRIRRVDAATGIITTIAGSTHPLAFRGDGGPALTASYWYLSGIAVDAGDNLFVADQNNQRIRRIDAATGIVTTVAGNGEAGFSGDSGPARLAALDYPGSLTFDQDGSLLVSTQSTVRRITPLDLNASSILAASPSQLTKPRNKMADVTVTFADTSLCTSPSAVLLAISSNEPDDLSGGADGQTVNDIQGAAIGTADYDFSVRVERSRKGTGRIYQADYLVTCGSGEQTVSSVFVTVPL